MIPHLVDNNSYLLDSCIAEYVLDKYMKDAVSSHLLKWSGSTLHLAISEITFTELIDGAYKEKIQRVTQLLNSYTQIEVSRRVLTGAAILSNVYQKKYSHTCGASLQDKIIGATAFIYNIPIITANVSDFPYPLFTPKDSVTVEYTKKVKDRLHYQSIAILTPNTTELNYWYSKLQ